MNREPIKVAQGVYMLEVPFPPGYVPPDAMGGSTRCYLVQQETGWLLVDSGFGEASCLDSLCGQLAYLGLSPKDIGYLVITHAHPDHFGLAQSLKAISDIKVIMHRRDWDNTRFFKEFTSTEQVLGRARYLGLKESDMEGFNQLVGFGKRLFSSGISPDIVLDGNDEPVGDGRLRAILTPGHTPGHVCLYDPENRLLFSGDHVLRDITSHIDPNLLTSENPLKLYLESLKRVSLLNVDLVLPGHGEPFSGLRRRVEGLLQHHEQRLNQVMSATRHHQSSPWEIARQIDWSVGPWEHMDYTNRVMAMRETLVHLQLLEEEQRLAMSQVDGLLLYGLREEAP